LKQLIDDFNFLQVIHYHSTMAIHSQRKIEIMMNTVVTVRLNGLVLGGMCIVMYPIWTDNTVRLDLVMRME